MPSRYRIVHDGRLRVMYVEHDRGAVESTVAGMETAIRSVENRFGLMLDWPLVNVFLAPSRVEYDELVAHLTPTPTQPGRVGQPQGHDLYLLSPEVWPSHAVPELLGRDGSYDPEVYRRLLLHETVHMVEERISPSGAMEARPAWFSEGLAVYVSRQYCTELDLIDGMLAKLEQDHLPPLSDMRGQAAYLWGWTVIRFLERRFGWERIVVVLRETNTANVLDCFGDFLEPAWRHEAAAEVLREEIRAFADSNRKG